jgi:hypothetical protein
MIFIVFLVAVVVAAVVHALVVGGRVLELLLLYLLIGYYGFSMLFGAWVHLTKPDALDAYKGFPIAGKPMHTLYAAALMGVALASILCIWFRGNYVLGPAISGSILSLGGAYLHLREMIGRGTFIAGKDGPEILFDVVVPVTVLTLAIAHVVRGAR